MRDELAGKAVKCPGCGAPLRIAAAPVKSAAPPGPQAPAPVGVPGPAKAPAAVKVAPSKPPAMKPAAKEEPPAKIIADEALLKFEEAQKKKQLSAEEEAVYRDEHNKLIASYDQLTGRKAKEGEKKKRELAEAGVPKRPTVFTKMADGMGALFGTFAFKYLFITVLLAGGVLGSVYLVKYITSYMSQQTVGQPPTEQKVRELMDKAEKLVEEKKWNDAAACLKEVIQLDPKKDMNRDYQRMIKMVQESGA